MASEPFLTPKSHDGYGLYLLAQPVVGRPEARSAFEEDGWGVSLSCLGRSICRGDLSDFGIGGFEAVERLLTDARRAHVVTIETDERRAGQMRSAHGMLDACASNAHTGNI